MTTFQKLKQIEQLMQLKEFEKMKSLLELQKRIGLTLTDTCEMVPTKSVTAFIGLDL